MKTSAKQKPAVAVRLSDDLELYLRNRAAEGHRTLTSEIRMRLDASRNADEHAAKRKDSRISGQPLATPHEPKESFQ